MNRIAALSAVPIVFACGYLAGHTGLPPAHAQTPPATLAPQIINLTAMTNEDIGPQVPNMGTLRTKGLVATPCGTPPRVRIDAAPIESTIRGR